IRVGAKEALTIVGKKRAAQYERLMERQAERLGKKLGGANDEGTIDDRDVIEEEGDESPTPPRHDPEPYAPIAEEEAYAPQPASRPFFDESTSPANTPRPFAQPSTGLRFRSPEQGSVARPIPRADPAAARRRVAELAAQVQAGRAEQTDNASFGALDLDFD